MSGTTLHGLYEEWEREEKSRREQSERLKELFKAAKSDGWNAKALRVAFAEKYAIDHEAKPKLEKRSQDASDADLYLAELSGPRTPAYPRVEIIEEFGAETGEITEPQPAPQAGSDLTTPQALNGQVADIQPETANQSEPDDAAVTAGDVLREPAAAEQGQNIREGDAPRETDRSGGDASRPDTDAGSSNGRTAAFDAVNAGSTPAPASITYPAPGLVVMEHTPPEGIVAHPFAAVWPVNNIDVSEGVRQAIVKIGKLMLDGRGRYFAARAAGFEYPVVQYDGADPLMDSIRWNLDSRPNLHPHNLKIIATKLVKLEPSRSDEIMAAFGLDEEMRAAE